MSKSVETDTQYKRFNFSLDTEVDGLVDTLVDTVQERHDLKVFRSDILKVGVDKAKALSKPSLDKLIEKAKNELSERKTLKENDPTLSLPQQANLNFSLNADYDGSIELLCRMSKVRRCSRSLIARVAIDLAFDLDTDKLYKHIVKMMT